MKIHQADTYKYEMKHFGKLLNQDKGKEGACFDNVVNFCKEYNAASRNTSVSLVMGLRTYDDGHCTMGYHYLVRDDDTLEFVDPQYWRYTFVELHNWTLDDYNKDCDEFHREYGFTQSSEFFQWYCSNGYRKVFQNSIRLIKSLSDIKISDKSINEYFKDEYVNAEPKYGTKQLHKLNVY